MARESMGRLVYADYQVFGIPLCQCCAAVPCAAKGIKNQRAVFTPSTELVKSLLVKGADGLAFGLVQMPFDEVCKAFVNAGLGAGDGARVGLHVNLQLSLAVEAVIMSAPLY